MGGSHASRWPFCQATSPDLGIIRNLARGKRWGDMAVGGVGREDAVCVWFSFAGCSQTARYDATPRQVAESVVTRFRCALPAKEFALPTHIRGYIMTPVINQRDDYVTP